VPVWTKRAIDGWTQAAGIDCGRIFRALTGMVRFGVKGLRQRRFGTL
jgi:hypothetical protein